MRLFHNQCEQKACVELSFQTHAPLRPDGSTLGVMPRKVSPPPAMLSQEKRSLPEVRPTKCDSGMITESSWRQARGIAAREKGTAGGPFGDGSCA